MVFSSLIFLYFFLPLVLLLHTILPWNRAKNLVLLLASLVFYAWGEPVYILLMVLSISFNYVGGLMLDVFTLERERKLVLISTLAGNLFILGFFKYYGFVVNSFNSLFHLNISVHALALPIGISFYTFQALSYVIDVYWRKTEVQKNPLDFALYITMFPQLVAGPIVKYTDIALELGNRVVKRNSFARGLERLVFGLSKKVLLANNLGLIYSNITAAPERSLLTTWLGAVCYTMQIYFDFSGYSDMAIGMGKMLGFSFPENFNYPYLATSITDFWRRWHMTLSGWFREYVYIPLGGNRVSVGRHILNLMIVWGLTGLWHGAGWNFIFWGVYYGLLLVVEKYLFAPVLERMPMAARRVMTLLLVMFGWMLFEHTDFAELLVYLKNMIGIGTCGFADMTFLYLLRSNLLLFTMGIVCCTPILAEWSKMLRKKSGLIYILTMCGLFLISTAYLVYGSYNPFLYFRF